MPEKSPTIKIKGISFRVLPILSPSSFEMKKDLATDEG
jgi:hypothetical protein